jgi:Na+/H+ antiporter NhaA
MSSGPPAPTAAASGERSAWARNLGAPVRAYLAAETGGAIVLVAAALAAMLWANSPWPDSYASVWNTRLAVELGPHVVSADLRTWVDEGLMTLFFLNVGLEAKRELDLGELRERTRLTIPVVAALGGMTGAVLTYLAINAGGPGAHGWGAAMSTDTALALGVLALVAPAGSTRLRVFLLTMVVIDDVVALFVIAVFYTDEVSVVALLIALGLFAVLVLLRFAPRGRTAGAFLVAGGTWLALFESGIDPVIAGLAIGLVTSAYPPSRDDLERATELTRSFREQPTVELAYSAQRSLTSSISLNERMLYLLHPWVSFGVVPLFALANAGVRLDGGVLGDALTSPVTIGIVVAYVVGKPVGILAASWLATRRMFGGARLAITWPGLVGTGAVTGMAFTVSFLIAGRAFEGEELQEAKIGIIAAAVLAALVGALVFAVVERMPAAWRARQLVGMPGELVDLAEDVDPERDHVRGPMDAAVTLVEYGDYECPFCGRAENIVTELLAVRDDVRYVFRHLPLNDVHPHAQLAAEAAEAAAAQGRFWDLHDVLFDHQDDLTLPAIERYAAGLGLDAALLSEDVRTRRLAPRVTADVASADASGVSGTPTFFVNGRRHQGAYDVDALVAAVARARALELARAGVLAAPPA